MARKKSRKKLRVAREFAVKIFGKNIVREILGFFLILGILYFVVSGVLILALRTDTYWRAVISDSMKHEDESWREYFEARGYDPSQFPLQGGFEKGDMLIVQGISSVSEIAIGDVVIMDLGPGRIPLVHRVVEIWQEDGKARIRTKGDYKDYAGEQFNPEDVLGKAVFVIPELGWLSLWFQGRG